MSVSYIYDYGDYWKHEITLVDSRFVDREYDPYNEPPAIDYTKGKNSCPPEDIGGVGGYIHFCEVMENPKSEVYDSMVQWHSSRPWRKIPFDKKFFDVELVNIELAKYTRWSRDRRIPEGGIYPVEY